LARYFYNDLVVSLVSPCSRFLKRLQQGDAIMQLAAALLPHHFLSIGPLIFCFH
jgi:hypothetical protein